MSGSRYLTTVCSMHFQYSLLIYCRNDLRTMGWSEWKDQKHLYCKNACHSFMPLHSRIFCDEKDVAPVWLSHDVWHRNFLRFLSWLNYNSALECKLLFFPQNICLELDLVYWQEYLKFQQLFILVFMNWSTRSTINSFLWTEYVRHFVPLHHSIFLQRRIIPKPSRHTRNDKQKRPRRYWREWCV